MFKTSNKYVKKPMLSLDWKGDRIFKKLSKFHFMSCHASEAVSLSTKVVNTYH